MSDELAGVGTVKDSLVKGTPTDATEVLVSLR